MNKILRYSFVALMAMVFGNAMADTTDELTATSFAIPTAENEAYGDFAATGTSGAAYKTQANGKQNYIQIRSNKNNSGIVVTTSGGYVKSITIAYNSGKTGTNVGEIDVYAKNEQYSVPADLYDTSKRGTKVGQITASSTTYTFNNAYTYFGFRSTQGTRYIDKVTVVWTDQAPSGGGENPGTTEPTDITTVADIAAFKALAEGTEAKLTLTNAKVLFANGNDIYVKDNTGAIDFFKTGLSIMTTGSTVSGTVIGKYSPYNNLPEFVKTDYTNDEKLSVTAGTVSPTELTLANVSATYICDFIKLTNVKVTQKTEGDYTNNYATDGTNEVFFYNKFGVSNALAVINTEKPDNTYDIEGILIYQSGKLAIGVTKAVAINTETGPAYQNVGDGTKDNPYTIADLKHMTDYPSEKQWVKGVIIGSAESSTKLKTEDVASNIAIAESATATSFIPVELKNNTSARTKLNVADNPSNKGKEVKLYGKIQSYFSTTGVKELEKFILDGTEEEVTSGVSTIKADADANAPAYNVAGQRVAEGYKGLIIKSGKKVVIK